VLYAANLKYNEMSLLTIQGLNKEILVTARTDPGWVPLYPLCSGLIIERGRSVEMIYKAVDMNYLCTPCIVPLCSLLSHSAVVARELGLPTIVGVSGGLMKRLKVGSV